MSGIGYITGQRVRYEVGKSWSMERSITYRAIGLIFIVMGAAPLLIPFFHSTPLWFYILPLSLLIPGISIATFSEGVDIDARTNALVHWFKILGFGRKREIQFSELKGVYIEKRLPKNTTSGFIVFDVRLIGDKGSIRAYTASSDDEVEKVVERISALTGLPRTQSPSQQLSTRKLLIVLALFLSLPILIMGLFVIIKAIL